MTYRAGVSSFVMACLFAASWTASAGEPSFAELLARAQAQVAAGHEWAPPGDNAAETFTSMVDALGQATPRQIEAFEALLEQVAMLNSLTRERDGYPDATGPAASRGRNGQLSTPVEDAPTTPVGQPDQPTVTDQTKITSRTPMDPAPGASPVINPPSAAPYAAPPTPAADARSAVTRQSDQHASVDTDTATNRLPFRSAPVGESQSPSPRGAETVSATVPRFDPTALPPTAWALSASAQRALLERGDAMLSLNDVVASRLLYKRAADGGLGVAAFKLAQTYDPAFLAAHNLGGVRPDPAAADVWYRKAEALGYVEVIGGLKGLAGR